MPHTYQQVVSSSTPGWAAGAMVTATSEPTFTFHLHPPRGDTRKQLRTKFLLRTLLLMC
jgi:hypothetical protein